MSDQSTREILAKAGLWINDPEDYPGLVEQMNPAQGLDLSFAALRYDTALTTKRKVPCSICPQHQLHNRGAVVRLKSGQIGLVGHECGDRHFFGDGGWQELRNRLDKSMDDALIAHRWGPARDALTSIINVIEEWIKAFTDVNVVQSAFRLNLPKLSKKMEREIGLGELVIERQIQETLRDFSGHERTITRYVNETMFRTQAAWFFQGKQLSQQIKPQIERINHVISLLRPDPTDHNVNAIRRIMREIYNSLSSASQLQDTLRSGFGPRSLQQLADWANEVRVMNGLFYEKDGLFNYKGKGGNTISIDFTIPVDTLQQHWRSISELWPRL